MRLTLTLLFASTFTLTLSLRCYSTVCDASERNEHGFCTETCRSPNEACSATLFVSPNQTITPGTFRCHKFESYQCLSTSCQFELTHPSFAYCCCRSDYCNIIPGIFGGITPAPPIILPTPSVAPPTSIAGDELVCEFNNCTATTTTTPSTCFHGYQNCSEQMPGANPGNYFCAVHATKNARGLYELERKGCKVTTNTTINSLGSGQSNCLLDTASSSDHIACYCDEILCNNVSNLVFTDPSRFIGTDPDVLCESAGCSHSCVITNGVPRCFCPAGYALHMDSQTCTDINECLDPHQHLCSHICNNTEGSYRCECPADSGLRLTTNGTHCEPIPGLVCQAHNLECNDSATGLCENVVYCDRQLPHSDPDQHICTAVVYYSWTSGKYTISLQSCLTVSHYCDTGVCNLRLTSGISVFSCCCKGNLCNSNINFPNLTASTGGTALPLTTTSTELTTSTDAAKTTELVTSPEAFSGINRTIFIIAVVVVVALSLILCIVCGFCCYSRRQKKRHDDNYNDIDIGSIPMSTQLLPPATHFEHPPIGSGRFSTVYKEPVEGEDRAIKVFQRKDKTSYERELAIYREQNFKHPNVLLFIINNEYPEELQLIFEYHPNGSLYDVLNRSPISMKEFCNIAISSARGLAYLHTEIHKDGSLYKSCVAHRDLKSKNILIKADGTACISDFGLAIKWPLETQNEAQGQVGTARYMAPEVLEGAISFDREAYFRIDVYAFSLILWELTSRTKALNSPVSEYRPPFDEMVPPNPSIEDMRKVVVDWQKRPTIPKVFTNHSGMDDIVSTIQETWDKDADARLSAQCVCERLNSFMCKFESMSKDSGQFGSVEPITSSVSGSPTNTIKPPLSEASTNGYPNAVLPSNTSTAQELVSSNHHRPMANGLGGATAGPHPQCPTGGNPMILPVQSSYNVAPPLHAPGEFHYRFIQAPSFPRHPPSNANSYNPQHQPSQLPRTSAHDRELNNRNSHEIPHPPVHTTHSIMESTV